MRNVNRRRLAQASVVRRMSWPGALIVAVADSLLISKTDLAAPAQVASLREKLAAINPGARIFNVTHGEFDPRELFAGGIRDSAARADDVERWLAAESFRPHRGSSHSVGKAGGHANGLHDDGLLTFSLCHETPVQRSALALWLNMLSSFRGHDLLRVKGVVNVEGEPVVIHVVQTIIHEPVPLQAWPSEDRRSRIVFITRDITQEEISRTFVAFSQAAAAIPSGMTIDPEAYANFVQLARNFIR